MEKQLAVNYPIYDTVYGNEIPTEQYYVILFDRLPSKSLDDKVTYNPLIISHLSNLGFKEDLRIVRNNKRHNTHSQSLFINKDKKILLRTSISTDKLTLGNTQLEFLFDIKDGELKEQIDIDSFKKYMSKRKKANIQLVKSDMGHLDTEDYDLIVPPMDLELNYGDEFRKIHKVILERLNKSYDKGIILLHGDPGTGKTSYIKYLTSLVKDKDVLFIPPSMAEMLSEPTIIPFLMDHKNSILIIEDAERVISDRENNGSPAGVSNILNLTDGILGDCLNIQVIATFNIKREKIDQALLRKGRLIAEHKFEKLSMENTNKLLKSLKKDFIVEEGMVLADIYNIETEVFKSTNKTNKIGF